LRDVKEIGHLIPPHPDPLPQGEGIGGDRPSPSGRGIGLRPTVCGMDIVKIDYFCIEKQLNG
jgi:hypothetical protein